MKKILLTNDDGVFAPGINAVAKVLCNDYEICVVAPETQKSGASQSISIRNPIAVKEVELQGLQSVKAYAVTGTPADCVKIAIGTLKLNPDLIISGMNLGANVGTDVMYSGTIGAAIEAALLGYPALALSVVSHDAAYVEDAAKACRSAVDFYINNTDVCRLLSVNVPNVPLNEMKGIAITHLSKRQYPSQHELGEDGLYRMPPWEFHTDENNTDCDEYMICKKHITWTPLLTDICDCASIDKLRATAKSSGEIK